MQRLEEAKWAHIFLSTYMNFSGHKLWIRSLTDKIQCFTIQIIKQHLKQYKWIKRHKSLHDRKHPADSDWFSINQEDVYSEVSSAVSCLCCAIWSQTERFRGRLQPRQLLTHTQRMTHHRNYPNKVVVGGLRLHYWTIVLTAYHQHNLSNALWPHTWPHPGTLFMCRSVPPRWALSYCCGCIINILPSLFSFDQWIT